MKRYANAGEIKVGVIGYGGAFNMGRKHLAEMKSAGMTPVAVCEIDTERLAVAAIDYPEIETYERISDMLKNSAVDLLAIITPHNTHAKLALQCLRAGRHVVSEKPLAITTAECDKMIKEAEKQEVVLSTYHNRHWDGCIMQAGKTIGKGIIGDVLRIEAHMGGYAKPREWWRSSKTISGGILYDWGVHLLEYSLQLIDSEIVEVAGFAHGGHWAPGSPWKEDANEDEAMAVVRFSDGRSLQLTMSSIDANSKGKDRGQLEITGTKGTYIFDNKTWRTIIPKAGGKTVITEGVNPPSESESFYRNIAAHLTGKEDLVITPEWSRRPIHILDLACRSAERNKTLSAKYR